MLTHLQFNIDFWIPETGPLKTSRKVCWQELLAAVISNIVLKINLIDVLKTRRPVVI